MTASLERVTAYFEEFRESVNGCRSADSFKLGNWKGAYGALGRLRDRYLHEKGELTSAQRAARQKVFENDTFIEGMMELRQVGEHVIRRGEPLIRTTGNAPIRLTVETSAMAVFAAPIVVLRDVKNTPHTSGRNSTLRPCAKNRDPPLTSSDVYSAHLFDVPTHP
jgi:hypothetical protein